MAQRRMFSSTVTDSDFFLEMPLSTQALYFHIGMKADDDGFCSSAKTIMRTIGANQNDLDLLIAKSFLIKCENGVVVVKHWRVNNFIRKDTYHSTEYVDEKKKIYLKPNGIYTTDPSKGTPLIEAGNRQFVNDVSEPRQRDVNEPSTQVSIGKARLDQSSLVETSIAKESKEIELDRTRYNQPALLEILIASGFVKEDEIDDGWDDVLNLFVKEYGFVDTKVKLKYFLRQTCHIAITGEDKNGKPIFGSKYENNGSIGDRYLYFSTSMDNSFRKLANAGEGDDDELF